MKRNLLVSLERALERYRSDIYDMANLFYRGNIEFAENGAIRGDGAGPAPLADLLVVARDADADAVRATLVPAASADCAAEAPPADLLAVARDAAQADPAARGRSANQEETAARTAPAAQAENPAARAGNPAAQDACAGFETAAVSFAEIAGSGRYALKMLIYGMLKARLRAAPPWGALVGVRPVKRASQLMAGGSSARQAAAYLEERYDVSATKAGMCVSVALNEKRFLDAARPGDAALYVGIPFCRTKCAYCSFPSDAFNKAEKFAEPYLSALRREIAFIAEHVKGRAGRLLSIYVGGGTPTALSARQLAELLDCLSAAFGGAGLEEVTVEAGRPDTVDREKLECIRANAPNAGALRICVNPQTMNPGTLRLIGREHAPEDIVRVFCLAREMGFDNINMDIIAGLPEETPPMFESTVGRVADLNPDGITVHTLSVKRSSRINEFREKFGYPPDAAVAAMLDKARIAAAALGMAPYYLYRQKNTLGNLENVGYAKSGRECIYNIHEMADRIDILAVGAGAATKLVDLDTGRIERVFNAKNLVEYIERIDEMIERKKQILWAWHRG
jgi:oxygen-independent coproporphyrinogen-3 oxidase